MYTRALLVLLAVFSLAFIAGYVAADSHTVYASEDCEPQAAVPYLWAKKFNGCPPTWPPVYLEWLSVDYEDVHPLGCEPYGSGNPAYYAEFEITMCGLYPDKPQTGEVRGYTAPAGDLLVTYEFDEDDDNVVRT